MTALRCPLTVYSCCYAYTDICKQVNVASGSGAVNITENSTTTTGAEYSVITQNISARYSSFNDTGVIYVQVRDHMDVFPYYCEV